MKRAILIAITVLAASGANAHAAERDLNVLLTGGPEANVLDIKLSLDGRSYIIDSTVPLEAGGGICTHAEGNENRLLCEATAIAGFEVNAGAGDDSVVFSPRIMVSVTLRGGPGSDRLRAGGGGDKLVGGAGEDVLLGSGGDDWLFGGLGGDWLYGGSGKDRLVGGPGSDFLHGGPGKDTLVSDAADYTGPAPH
jgi:Ca2+-binding RTX toxin-like protein